MSFHQMPIPQLLIWAWAAYWLMSLCLRHRTFDHQLMNKKEKH